MLENQLQGAGMINVKQTGVAGSHHSGEPHSRAGSLGESRRLSGRPPQLYFSATSLPVLLVPRLVCNEEIWLVDLYGSFQF